MTRPLRGLASSVCAQWRLSSSSARAPRQQPRAPPAKPPPRVTRPYKPPARRPDASPPPPPRQPDTLLSLWRRSWLPLTGAALAAGFLGFYIVGTVTASAATTEPCFCPAGPGEHAPPTGRPPALTGDNAEQFDRELDGPEWRMGITGLRKRIAQLAAGHVLEIAVGSGRNLEYYNWEPLSAPAGRPAPRGLASFTGLDISVDMLDVARRRLVKAVPAMASADAVVKAATMADRTGGQLSFLGDRLRLIHSDAHRPLPPPPPPLPAAAAAQSKYDTIVQTFGLCSVCDPVAVLSNVASAVKPGSGRIILLEHGKGWYGLVNGLLDRFAGRHFAKYGCWWNRDIEAVVERAVQLTPGLEIVKLQRPNIWQLGTLVWVELRVADKA